MPYFQDTAGGLHFLSEGDIANGCDVYLPAGSVEITEDQAKVIQNPPPSAEQQAEQVRAQRDQRLQLTEWFVQRHRDEIEMSKPTTLSASQFSTLQAYRQALRDVPAQVGFPTSVTWPDTPTCMKDDE